LNVLAAFLAVHLNILTNTFIGVVTVDPEHIDQRACERLSETDQCGGIMRIGSDDRQPLRRP